MYPFLKSFKFWFQNSTSPPPPPTKKKRWHVNDMYEYMESYPSPTYSDSSSNNTDPVLSYRTLWDVPRPGVYLWSILMIVVELWLIKNLSGSEKVGYFGSNETVNVKRSMPNDLDKTINIVTKLNKDFKNGSWLVKICFEGPLVSSKKHRISTRLTFSM